VALGDVQRLRHGGKDFPIGGGPDILNALHAQTEGGQLIGVAGDSYVQIVEFSKTGSRFWSIQPFGNINRKKSPHYSDQAPLFVKRQLRPGLRKEKEIRRRLESEYHPGDEAALKN
jgi:acyl-homoserine lactone acylase PvdQ